MTLTIISPAPSTDRSGARVLVRCDCGVEKVVRRKHVVTGQIKSCGCANLAVIAARRAAAEERKRRKSDEMPELVVRFVPAAWYRTDRQLLGACIIALSADTPRTLADLTRVIDADDAELAERCAVLRGHVEAVRLECGDVAYAHSHGVRTSNGSLHALRVFGRELAACDGGRGKVAA